MKVLHIFTPDTNNKFSKDFIELIKSNFKNHYFFLLNGKNLRNKSLPEENVKIIEYNFYSIQILLNSYQNFDKVVLHGLHNHRYLELSLLIYNGKFDKFFWFIWGGDLYTYINKNKNTYFFFRHLIKKLILSKIINLVTFLESDFKLAKIHYSPKAIFHYCLMYPSNTIPDSIINLPVNNNFNTIKIMVGNSASVTNNHIEILTIIKNLKIDRNIEIYCPLSYPILDNQNYINNVVDYGIKHFGRSFIPILDFLPLIDYLKFLNSIDVAVFNFKYQQGLGNTISLLSLGKVVFLREIVSQFDFFKTNKIKVFSIEKDLHGNYFKSKNFFIEDNIPLSRELFSSRNLISQIKKLFS